MVQVGVHVSIAGGLHKGLLQALEVGCDCAQLFLLNPRSWKTEPLSDEVVHAFKETRQKQASHLFPLVVHMPYLPNLSAQDPEIQSKSVHSLRENLLRCDRLGIDYLVTHMGKGEGEDVLPRMKETILRAYRDDRFNTCLLLENSAGQGTERGYRITELATFRRMLPAEINCGICLDTCHAFAAGYPLATPEELDALVEEFEQIIGFDQVKVVHLNDALKEQGSRVDRHAKIGEGRIGTAGFLNILAHPKFNRLPLILEVPRKSVADDIEQVKLVRKLAKKALKP